MAEGESLPAGMLFTAVYVSPEWVAFSVNFFFSPPLSLSLSLCFVTVVIVVVVVVYEEGKRWSVKPTNSPSSLAAGQGQRERKKEKFCVRFFFFFLVLVLLLLSLLISLLLKAPGFYVIIQPFLSNFLCGVTSDKKMRLFLLFLFHFIIFFIPTLLFSSLYCNI